MASNLMQQQQQINASSEEDFSISDFTDSDEDEQSTNNNNSFVTNEVGGSKVQNVAEPKNLLQKLFNREQTGCFSGNSRHRQHPQVAYSKVPNRLSFCLKDIVPQCFLQGHMFMGLSACGQFLLSYKVCCNESLATNHYSFNIGYKYTLYFWTFQPHQPLRSFYKCCLFDDHGVDNLKEVTISQWKNSDPRVLIVHGAAEDENEDSYITYVKVPRLGCLECKKLRESEEDTGFYALCLSCNLTIHTKYSTTESDRKFVPRTNLICPGRILITANGFMHMLHIDLDTPSTTEAAAQQQKSNVIPTTTATTTTTISPHCQPKAAATPQYELTANLTTDNLNCDNQNNIVARIIADFSDIESDSLHSNASSYRPIDANSENGPETVTVRKTYDELIFTCSGSSPNTVLPGETVGSATVGAISHRGKRHHRIVTKSFRNGVITVDMQDSATSSATAASTNATVADKANAYEFSEDNEKCEKISTLRKRRLADKKYEFSEDNSENIIPFTKIRLASRNLPHTATAAQLPTPTRTTIHRMASNPTSHGHHYVFNSPSASPSSSPHPSPSTATATAAAAASGVHRASPIGIRSPPCNSPVSSTVAIMRSPSRQHLPATYSQRSPQPHLSAATQHMLSFKPLGALSPLQVSMTKRNYLEGSLSPNSANSYVPFLSPCREEMRVTEVPIQVGSMTEKPICTKKFKRRYVEEDTAASVITSEEDDCISPGYHTSLPMEVHGSCYSEMQMISQSSYQQLRCPSVVITQHSFDLETFIYFTISTLCQKHNKIYDVFYDWAWELIHICPHSFTVVSLLMAQFSARDQLPNEHANCLNCVRKLDCAFHRQHFECRVLFTWNMENGDCEVIDYGDLMECNSFDASSPLKRIGMNAVTLAHKAKYLAMEMILSTNGKLPSYHNNLRVLESNINKSKQSLVDLDAAVEFTRKRRQSNSSD